MPEPTRAQREQALAIHYLDPREVPAWQRRWARTGKLGNNRAGKAQRIAQGIARAVAAALPEGSFEAALAACRRGDEAQLSTGLRMFVIDGKTRFKHGKATFISLRDNEIDGAWRVLDREDRRAGDL